MNEQAIVVVMGVGISQEYRAEILVWNVDPNGELVIHDQDQRVIGTHARGQWLFVHRVARIEDAAVA